MTVKNKNDMKNGTAGNRIKQICLMWILPVLIVGCFAVMAVAQDFYSDANDHYTHFTFSVSTDCEVYVTVSMASGATGKVIPSIVDTGQTIVNYSDGVWKKWWLMGSENGATKGPVPLKAGNYALRVESAASHTVSTEIKTTLQVVEGSSDYGEDNDTVTSAALAESGYTYTATVGYKGIETQTSGYVTASTDNNHYWVITPSSDTTLTCTIDFSKVETDLSNALSYLTAGVYKMQGFSNLDSRVVSKPEKVVLGPFDVTTGTEYTILVKAQHNAYGAYGMIIDLDASGGITPSPPPSDSSTWKVGGIEWQQADKRNPSAAITQDSTGALMLPGAPWNNGQIDSSGYVDGNGVQTVSTYNFLGKTVRLKFKAAGPSGYYLWAVPGAAGLPYLPASTSHSWAGSTVISDDTWVYVRYTFTTGGDYDLAMATGNYDDQGGSLLAQDFGSLTSAQMADAKDSVLKVTYGDNYGGTAASLVLADAAIEDASEGTTTPQPCAVTINQDMSFNIPYAVYDGGPFGNQMALTVGFQFIGDQNGQMIWQLGAVNTASSSASTCSIPIADDYSFTIPYAVYDAGPLGGQMIMQVTFQYAGNNQNGGSLWYLADFKIID